jgi:hypothetical protein
MAKTKQQAKTDELLEDVKSVIQTQQGRNVLNHFITQGGYGLSAFKGATNETIHNCGMQSLAMQIVHMCQQASPDLHIKMIQERLNER